jgi:hypothetical protein
LQRLGVLLQLRVCRLSVVHVASDR